MIRIKNLFKIYEMGEDKVYALDDLSLEIHQGEFTSIVGPSGSGKSTLMNIIGCLDTPTSGEYFLAGEEVSKLSDNRLSEIRNEKIGFVFQKFNLLPKLSALENVELPLVYLGVSAKERKRRAEEALNSVGLLSRMKHLPTEMSGGQQQRVAIARALVTDPQIILADEPTGNLDSKTGEEVLKILQELNKKGRTVILITHDSHVAKSAKRTVEIMDGKIHEHEGAEK
ncbi:MAG: ABC transporter ATP-binding protein [Bacillota bacterium]|nr:ABC transporter ATP-binding protein [Bacillota bacterium]